MDEILCAQNQVIISLLARSIFGIEGIVDVIMRGSKVKNPEVYLKIYNMLDGTITGVEAARVAGVTKQAISQAFQKWENEGIIYKAGSTERPLYHHLLVIPEDVIRKSSKSGATKGKSQLTDVVAEEMEEESNVSE